LTGCVRRRIAALLHALEKATAFGSAAVPGRINPMTDLTPVSIMQILRPIIHRLGAAKNGRAPAGGGNSNGVGSAAVPGRINLTTDLTPVSIKQTRGPIFDRLGAAKNGRAPARAGKGNGARERDRPRPHQGDDRSCTCFN